jgi:hypothetical protein
MRWGVSLRGFPVTAVEADLAGMVVVEAPSIDRSVLP